MARLPPGLEALPHLRQTLVVPALKGAVTGNQLVAVPIPQEESGIPFLEVLVASGALPLLDYRLHLSLDLGPDRLLHWVSPLPCVLPTI